VKEGHAVRVRWIIRRRRRGQRHIRNNNERRHSG
jgi:hypothetical protein